MESFDTLAKWILMDKIYLPSFNLEFFPLTVADKSLMKLMGRR